MDNVHVVLGDITTFEGDAIVNAANERMLGGGGVDGAIHRAAGQALYEECLKVPEVRPGVRCPTGEARITDAGRLGVRKVIHTVGPVYRGGRDGERDQLMLCYLNSLRLAFENGCKRVAFPSISTGVYGYPVDKAAEVAVQVVLEFLSDHPDMEVSFYCFNGPRDRVDVRAVYEAELVGRKANRG